MKKILFWTLEIFFIFCFVSTCFFSCNYKPPEDFLKERIESVKLCSINTFIDTHTTGNFNASYFLFMGQANGSIGQGIFVISYVIETEYGMRIVREEWEDDFYIVEEDPNICNPRVENHIEELYRKSYDPFIVDGCVVSHTKKIYERVLRKIFYVPKGTVIRKFRIDP